MDGEGEIKKVVAGIATLMREFEQATGFKIDVRATVHGPPGTPSVTFDVFREKDN